MPTPAELFDLAVRYHQSGNFEQAESLYRQIIQTEPSHSAAHHLLGFLAHQSGRHETVITLIRQAITLEPANADHHFSLAIVLASQGQLAEAIACYRHTLRISPEHAEALINLGNLLKVKGNLDEAAACYRQALRVNPNHSGIHNNLGLTLKDLGQLDDAAECFRQAIRLNPQNAVPDNLDVYNNLGSVLMSQGHLAEAAACYRQVLAIDPGHANAHVNLGTLHKEEGQLDQAAFCYRQALGIDPRNASACNNLGNILMDQGQPAEAMALYSEALRLEPAHASTRCNLAQLRLLQGELPEAWSDYEYRWNRPGTMPYHGEWPRWDGSPFEGKTILLHPEQGLGDTIQFIRFAPLVQQRGGRVVFECQPELVPLLTGVPGVDQLVEAGTPLPSFDVHALLMSLPNIFGTTLATIPAGVPYLRADAARVEYWRQELAPLVGFKVGIAWQGSRAHKRDRYRSVRLTDFEALRRVEGVRFVSLQKGPGTEQLQGGVGRTASPAHVGDRFPVLDLSDRLDTFLDTAAVLMNLDLVVSVDTAVAHVAGALGVRVWVALAIGPDWRWLLHRADSLWYPTMRLFRQSRFGDWSEVFERIAAEVRETVWRARGNTPARRL
ncbi:MAG TPA: tetratricopeptide repeat protein [Gemmataceae bacterium]|nr:tetratricopeptide repeat protein [Gemmataceae bacterium]